MQFYSFLSERCGERMAVFMKSVRQDVPMYSILKLMRAKSWLSELNWISDARCTCCFSAHLQYTALRIYTLKRAFWGLLQFFLEYFQYRLLHPAQGSKRERTVSIFFSGPSFHRCSTWSYKWKITLKRYNSEINILHLPDLVSGRNCTLASCLRVGKDPTSAFTTHGPL